MLYYLYPETRHRKRGPTYSIRIQTSKGALTRLSGYDSLQHATDEAERLAPELNSGKITLDDLKAQRDRIHRGLSQLEWAKYFNIHRNSIYQGAKYQGITWQAWVEARLPPAKRLAYGSTEAFQLP